MHRFTTNNAILITVAILLTLNVATWNGSVKAYKINGSDWKDKKITAGTATVAASTAVTDGTIKYTNDKVKNPKLLADHDYYGVAGKYKKFNADYDDWFYFVEDTAWPELHRQISRPIKYGYQQHQPSSRSVGAQSYDQIDGSIGAGRYNNKSTFMDKLRKIGVWKDKCSGGECRTNGNGPVPRIRFSKVLDMIPNDSLGKPNSIPNIDAKEKVAKYLKDLAQNDIETPELQPPRSGIIPFAGSGIQFSHDDSRDDGPSHWHEIDPRCGGDAQSPVALSDLEGIPVLNFEPVAFTGLNNKPLSITLQNDGHSAKYTFQFRDGETPRITGGPLCCSFKMHHLHFHWGSTNDVGSEHTLNGRRYPMELHIVTYNEDYGSFEAASAMPKGLSVVTFFYDINDDENSQQARFLVPFLHKIRESQTEFVIGSDNTFTIAEIIGDGKNTFISYAGSLTTPPCSETVTWMIAREPIYIATQELNEFRGLMDDNGVVMVNNFRPLQPLNGRKLYYYF